MGIRILFWFTRPARAGLLVLFTLASLLNAAEKPEGSETNALKASAESPAEAQQALRAYLQLQEQVHQTMLSIEQSRKDTQVSVEKNAQRLEARLNAIEAATERQWEREAKSAHSSSRFALIVAICLGGLGLLVMLLTAWFLMKTVRQFSTITGLASGPALSQHIPAGLLADATTPLHVTTADNSGLKLLGAIERLEKRIHDIEHTGPTSQHSDGNNADHTGGNGTPEDQDEPQIALLLGKGQSLLHLDQADQAVACFNEVLALDPDHAEALVKKGAALEKLKRLEDAVECYDRAIAVDESMTLAYLYKGGVFNQLERFGEALQCYEKALRTQQKIAMH